eukprot:m.439955 g.439955  ORF g.439955 m.439955 type:complete len:796 (+) comp21460_c0_seq1:344-2731(+)
MATADAKPSPKFTGLVSGIYRRMSAGLSRTNEKSSSSDECDDSKPVPIISDSKSSINLSGSGNSDDVPRGNNSTGVHGAGGSSQVPSSPVHITVGDSPMSDAILDRDQTPISSPPTNAPTSGQESLLSTRTLPATPHRPTREASGQRGHARSVSQQFDAATIDELRSGGKRPSSISTDASSSNDDLDTDEDDGVSTHQQFPTMEGSLSKWTNYIHGWQSRWVVLKDGQLSYFRSKSESEICRSTVDLAVARIERHKFDSLRFDIRFGDGFFYLRTQDESEREEWVDALLATQSLIGGDGGNESISKCGSVASLASLVSNTSIGSGSIRTSAFHDKLTEIKTFHGLLLNLIDRINPVNASAEPPSDGAKVSFQLGNDPSDDSAPTEKDTAGDTEPEPSRSRKKKHSRGKEPRESVDVDDVTKQFLADSLLFKSTAAGMLQAVEDCADMARRREDEWKKRLAKSNDKRRRFEKLYREAKEASIKAAAKAGPDMQEGPHSMLTEEEWFDAIENAPDFVADDVSDASSASDSDSQSGGLSLNVASGAGTGEPSSVYIDKSDAKLMASAWHGTISAHISDSMQYRNDTSVDWEHVLDDDNLKVLRAQVMVGGTATDKNKTMGSVVGVTAKELCSFFWDINHKTKWESTVETCRVIEEVDEDTSVQHSIYIRTWPAAQREAINLVHRRPLGPNEWLAVSTTVDHDAVPAKHIRVEAKAALFAKTHLKEGAVKPYKRSDIVCSIEYYATVNPGGWAPPSVVQAVARREFPKTLKGLAKQTAKYHSSHPIEVNDGDISYHVSS